MKTVYRILIVLACTGLQQCEETNSPQVEPEFDDAATSASKAREPFVLYAIAPPGSYPPNHFLIYLGGTAGYGVTVDWGDGTSEEFMFNNNGPSLERYYDNPGRYKITITGDTREITYLWSGYGEGVYDSINVSSLRNLESIQLSLSSGPTRFDLSANKNLTNVDFTDVQELSDIILPKKHKITTISIAGPNQLSTPVVDYVIGNIYENAVKGELYNGYFNVTRVYYLNEDEEGYGELVGPPSANSIQLLKTLRDKYGWEIRGDLE